jgi:hypothetical protein
VAAVRGAVVRVPLGGCEPLHPPEAVQLSTFNALHCNVTLCPIGTVLSLDFSVSVGAEISLLVIVPAFVVTLVEVPEHAAIALSTVNASIDFKTNAQPTCLPLRVEFMLCGSLSIFAASIPPALEETNLQFRDHIIVLFLKTANLSLFAHDICSIQICDELMTN